MMKYQLFGRNTGLRVTDFCLGGGNFGSAFPNGVGAENARDALTAFADAGGNFIDTSSGYQAGQSEEIIGAFIKARRDDFVIGTKYAVGVDRSEHYTVRGGSRKAMMASIDGSLRRLQSDHVDLFWVHAHDATTPIEEILRGMDDLVTAGKVLYVGFANFPAWRLSRGALLAEVRAYAPLTGIQIEYSAAERDADRELIPMAEALGLGVTVRSILGGAFLSGKDKSRLPDWSATGRPNAKDQRVRTAVEAVAERLGATSAQVAAAWLFRHLAGRPTAFIPIIGARNGEQVRQLMAAQELDISDAQVAEISQAGAPDLGSPHDNNMAVMDFIDGGPRRPSLHPAV